MDRRLPAWLLAATLAASLAGCSSAASPASGAASPQASDTVTVADAWVRATPTTDTPTAGYLAITNGASTDDALLSASSPVAGSVEIHETSTSSGMTGMQPVDRIPVAAGATVKLEPGGYHLMIMGLTKPLATGESVELDLVFEHAGRVVVQAEVRQG